MSLFDDEDDDGPAYSPRDLVFVEFHYFDPVKETKSLGYVHLAHFTEGRLITSCGIQTDEKVPDVTRLTEPKKREVCPMCSTRSDKFSKQFYGGVKLKFTKSKKKEHMVAHDSDEEAYRTERYTIEPPANMDVPF